jgi:hypothetical protein
MRLVLGATVRATPCCNLPGACFSASAHRGGPSGRERGMALHPKECAVGWWKRGAQRGAFSVKTNRLR